MVGEVEAAKPQEEATLRETGERSRIMCHMTVLLQSEPLVNARDFSLVRWSVRFAHLKSSYLEKANAIVEGERLDACLEGGRDERRCAWCFRGMSVRE